MKRLTITVVAILGLIGAVALAQSDQSTADRRQSQHKITDRNRDGLCDACGQAVGTGLKNSKGQKARSDYHYGPANGAGNRDAGPGDGTGYGAKSGKRSGNQDGFGKRMGRTQIPGAAGAKAKGNRGRKRP